MQLASPVKNLIQLLKNSGNPEMMVNQVLMQNPRFKDVMKYVEENGGDPKQAFYKFANDNGINPDEVLNVLK